MIKSCSLHYPLKLSCFSDLLPSNGIQLFQFSQIMQVCTSVVDPTSLPPQLYLFCFLDRSLGCISAIWLTFLRFPSNSLSLSLPLNVAPVPVRGQSAAWQVHQFTDPLAGVLTSVKKLQRLFVAAHCFPFSYTVCFGGVLIFLKYIDPYLKY